MGKYQTVKSSYYKNPLINEETIKVVVNKDVPLEIGCVAFDAINCLRSSLDHTVFAATTDLTKEEFDPKTVKFPFGDTYENLKSEFARGARNVPKELHDIILGFKPHKSGNYGLWGFNRIRNSNIHRVLSATASAGERFSILGSGGTESIHLINEWDPINRELTYAKIRNKSKQLQLEITTEVTFAEETDLPGVPLLKSLVKIREIASDIVDCLEVETKRLLS